MEPQINTDELEAIEQYLRQANQGQLQEQLKYATYSDEEIRVIFPSIQKLLHYKAQENKRLAHPDRRFRYSYGSLAGADNPRHTFSLVINHSSLLAQLVTDYRREWAKCRQTEANSLFMEQQSRQRELFDLNISEMSEEQYAHFKQLIGA